MSFKQDVLPEPDAAAVSRDLTAPFTRHLQRGAKPESEWRCGIEFEVIGYDARRNFERLDSRLVQAVLTGLASDANSHVCENEVLVEVRAGDTGRVTVEPGGQIEFSGAPHRSLAAVERDLSLFLTRLKEIGEFTGLTFLQVGYDPLRSRTEQHWFPKMRYRLMRSYLDARGARAPDMMCRTGAVQVNLDYSSETDLAKKFALGNRLAPVVTAMFANSPFENGKLSGYKSTRAAAWLDTDGARTGSAPPALLENFSFDEFVRYTLDLPIVFARRGNAYLDFPTSLTFGDFFEGANRVEPIFQDWTDHLSTIFTDARLKQYVELRSADCNNLALSLALSGLWKGLMYDPETLDDALRLAPKLNHEDARELRQCVAREGLAAQCAGVDVLAVAKEAIGLAAAGLNRIAPDEVHYLDVLQEMIAEDEVCPSDVLLRNFHGSWHRSMEKVIEYLRIA